MSPQRGQPVLKIFVLPNERGLREGNRQCQKIIFIDDGTSEGIQAVSTKYRMTIITGKFELVRRLFPQQAEASVFGIIIGMKKAPTESPSVLLPKC